MSLFFSESAWLSLAATAVLGGMLLCRSKRPGQLWSQVLCLAGLWGGACLLGLSLLCSLLLLLLSCFLLYTCSSDQELLPVDQKAVLVTGADSGFGHALSKNLDKLGFTVFAGVLDAKGSGAEELRRTCSERLSVLQMDVTKVEQIKDAHSKVTEKIKDKGLWAVVNNAGVFQLPIDGELIPMTHYRRCMAVNFFGAVEVTKVFLPLLRKSKGRLVNVSSMGDITGPPETWDKMEKEILDHLSQEIQDDYGQDYVRTQKNLLPIMKDRSCSDITPVLRDIEHAISARSPSSLYTPGRLTYLWICFSSYSPTSLLDYISQKFFVPKQMPKALRG
ncbi:estradiol 17-beta-dehydrogenase 2 [Onychomys torridus]|uniref:estradiol 17-beta-dehydrogenase 2 n=1 Tax=Onychomys torridus TaxID=38674 RepID=UPI00167FBDAC|nr:estradiol 17-beta-dehydrogenase 2 [Onychomys torridus]